MSEELYVPDCLFPTDNELEIPSLLIERQPRYAEIPFVRYGEQKRTFQMNGRGTLCFYTDDYKFNGLWEHPETILKSNPSCIVEPNFSLYADTPVAFGLQLIYKKRHIARQMQDHGINVFVDLNVDPKFLKFNLQGVPMGWSSFCTRGYSDRPKELEFDFQVAKAVARGNRLLFVVYGGGETVKQFCRRNGCVYVTPRLNLKTTEKRLNVLKEYKDTIAFMDLPSVSECVDERVKALYEGQVEDFSRMLKE